MGSHRGLHRKGETSPQPALVTDPPCLIAWLSPRGDKCLLQEHHVSFMDAGSVFSLLTTMTALGEFYLH